MSALKFVSAEGFKVLARGESLLPPLGIRKATAAEIAAVGDRGIRFTVSTDAVDRDRDRVIQSGWRLDNFRRNPVVLLNHDADGLPVGRCTSIGLDGDALVAVVDFLPADIPLVGPRAEAIYRMCREGFMSATSVGFRPLQWEWAEGEDRDGGCDYQVCELLEFSVVSIPANPQALIDPASRAPAPEPEPEPEPAPKSAGDLNSRGRRRRLATLRALT